MNKTILIAEDNCVVRQYIAEALIEAGYAVLEADDGMVALAKLDGRRIDLIISDLEMPNMGGIDFIKAARQIALYKSTPVIIHSSVAKEIETVGNKLIEAKAWLNKPVMPEDLIAIIVDLLQSAEPSHETHR